jgi:hypothetical protein
MLRCSRTLIFTDSGSLTRSNRDKVLLGSLVGHFVAKPHLLAKHGATLEVNPLLKGKRAS